MPKENGSIGLDAVTLVSIFVESVLYGLFVFLFITSTIVLCRKFKSSSNGVNKPLLAASIIMFILATIHIGVDLRRMLDAFLNFADTKGGPIGYLSQVDVPIYVLKSTAYAMQTLVGDAFILYRLYLVWNGDKRVVLPILVCFIASIGVGIGALQAFARAAPDEPVFITQLQDWIVSFFSLTLFTNFSSTSLIAMRIWWNHRKMSGVVSGRSLVPAAVVIIESGAIYSACLVILLSLYLSGSFAQYIVLDAVTQVIGVVFSLVIVRVALGISSETAVTRTRLTMFNAAADVSNGRQITALSDGTGTSTLYDLKPLRVEVTKVTDSRRDSSIAGGKVGDAYDFRDHDLGQSTEYATAV
ncbi:hypothetical protein BDQ17DRAFT_1303828 [Cyathus striatus]|nr:hypothetical protein BDQ17DRAFT_1303828 [Cyathus striatus]